MRKFMTVLMALLIISFTTGCDTVEPSSDTDSQNTRVVVEDNFDGTQSIGFYDEDGRWTEVRSTSPPNNYIPSEGEVESVTTPPTMDTCGGMGCNDRNREPRDSRPPPPDGN